jgi:hypothetical protein
VKYGAGILLMRYARTMGRANGIRRVSVVAYHYTLADALREARHRRASERTYEPLWIVKIDQPAHRSKKQRQSTT